MPSPQPTWTIRPPWTPESGRGMSEADVRAGRAAALRADRMMGMRVMGLMGLMMRSLRPGEMSQPLTSSVSARRGGLRLRLGPILTGNTQGVALGYDE